MALPTDKLAVTKAVGYAALKYPINALSVQKAVGYAVLGPWGPTVSKANVYTVIAPPEGTSVSKVNVYTVLSTETRVAVSKALVYTVLAEAVGNEIIATTTSTLVLVGRLNLTYDRIAESTFEPICVASATKSHIYEAEATSTLELADENTQYTVHTVTASSLLAPLQEVAPGKEVRPGSALLLRQTVGLAKVLARTVINRLYPTNTTALKGKYRKVAYSTLGSLLLHHVVGWKRELNRSTNNTLSITQSATVQRIKKRLCQSVLHFTHRANCDIGIKLSAASTLSLTQNASVILELDATISNRVNLTQTARYVLYTTKTPISELQFRHSAYGLALKSKRYLILQAPYNAIEETIILPNPELDDAEGLTSDVEVKRSMSGGTRTYVKRNKSRRLKYTLVLDRSKGLELIEFVRSYNSDSIRLQNWKGEIWKVNLTINPTDFVQNNRSYPDGDRTEVNLEFEGLRVI